MGIRDSILSYLRGGDIGNRVHYPAITTRSALGGQVIPWQRDTPQWASRSTEQYTTTFARQGLIYSCVEYLSNAAGSAPLRVYDPATDEAADDHPLRQLLVQPNPGMGEARFFSFLAMNMAVTGFVVVEKVRNGMGGPAELWPLRSDWLRPILRGDGTVDWEYKVPGYQEATILEAEDVIAIPYSDTPDVNMNPRGLGPLEVIFREAQISSALTDFLKVFMDRGAVPLYMLIPSDDPKLSAQFNNQPVKDAFMAGWRQRYGGLQNATEPMLSPGIKDIKRVGLDFNELAYPELNKLTDARICQAFGIPPILVGTQVGLERSTFSNTAEAQRMFYENTMTYLWTRIDDAFTRQLLPDFEWRPGWDIHFDTSGVPALQDNQNEVWTRATAALAAGGISRHTYHRLIGVDPHGPDDILQPFSVLPIPATMRATPKATATVSALPDDEMPMLDEGDRGRPPTFTYREGRRYINEQALTLPERQQRARIVDTNQRTIAALADVIGPRLESFFAGQKERIVQALGLRAVAGNGQHGVRFAAEAVDWAGEDDMLRQIFGQWWQGVQDAARGNAEALIGTEINWAVVNPYISDLTGILGQRIVGINAVTRTEIEDTLAGLMGQGTTVPEMGAAIESLFDQTFRNRHLTVARTESMFGYGHASSLAYQASGVVDRVQLHDNSSHTDGYGASDGLTCASRNGLVVRLDQVQRHLSAEHPNGSLSVSPVLTTPLGEA